MKTIEQKATAYAAGLSKTPGYDPAIRLAYLQGAEDALKSQWRPVEDELPEDGEKCVIMDKDGRVRAVIYDAKCELWRMSGGLFIYPVKTVHCWMPIPDCKGKERRKTMADYTDCCGNCAHFVNEDMFGNGFCELHNEDVHCSDIYPNCK